MAQEAAGGAGAGGAAGGGPGEGDIAPDFTLSADDGSQVSLRGLRGKRVILYFYPKDDTPGCTTQACEFQETLPRFSGADTVILGVSPDSVKSHVKFKEKFGLDFPLLADEGHALAEKYGVWKEKTNYGKKYMGVERSTFLIDPEGKIERAWRKVTPKGHAAELLALVEG